MQHSEPEETIERLIQREAWIAERRINLVRCILAAFSLWVLMPIRYVAYGIEGGSGNFWVLTGALAVSLTGALTLAWRLRFPRPTRWVGYVGMGLDFGVFAALIYAQVDSGFIPSIRQSLETYALILPCAIAINALSGLRLQTRQVWVSWALCTGLVLETVWIDTVLHGAPFYWITTLLLLLVVLVTSLGAHFSVKKTHTLIAEASRIDSEARRVKGTLSRYLSEPVVETILEQELSLGSGQRQRVTVLFSDIRGFTQLSERMPPEEVVKLLNSYFSRMVEVVFAYDGMLDKYLGDGMMAIFGAPLLREDHALRAVKAALRMREELVEFNRELVEQGHAPLSIGVGIHTGECVIGNIGSVRRLDYTAIGDTVNTASRIEGQTRQYGVDILISGETYREVQDRVQARSLPGVAIRGKTAPLDLFYLEGLEPSKLEPLVV